MVNLPRAVFVIHRADVHIIEPQGSELWLDVKTHTVAPEHSVAKELLREEDCQLRAVGSYVMHAAQSRLASACGMFTQNRPGRSHGHSHELA